MKRKPKRRSPRVSYTISLTWTKAHATNWWRKYNDNKVPYAPLKTFLEEIENDAFFCEYIEDFTDPIYKVTVEDYFNYVAWGTGCRTGRM